MADPTTTAAIGLLGVTALTSLYEAIFGGKEGRGMKERLAVVENDVKNVSENVKQVMRGIDDMKKHFKLSNRDVDKDSSDR